LIHDILNEYAKAVDILQEKFHDYEFGVTSMVNTAEERYEFIFSCRSPEGGFGHLQMATYLEFRHKPGSTMYSLFKARVVPATVRAVTEEITTRKKKMATYVEDMDIKTEEMVLTDPVSEPEAESLELPEFLDQRIVNDEGVEVEYVQVQEDLN
jgi:hypothetical protein